MLRSVTARPLADTLKTLVRHAGGGGRPGKKPAFNWKEKKLLKINGRLKEPNVGPFGDWADLEKFFDPSKGDVMIPWDEEEKSSEDPRLLEAMKLSSDKKRVNVKSLFGSSKPFGIIPKKEIPEALKKFNYERIFGEKNRRKEAERAAAATSATQKQ